MSSFTGQEDALTSLIDDLSSRSYGIPAISVLLKNKPNETLYSHIAGKQNLASDTLITPDTIFRLSSSTKLFTAVAALQCIERGLITLDEPVTTVLPEFANKQIITFEPDHTTNSPKFIHSATEAPITLRQLLTHTSGIGYDILHPVLQAWRKSRNETPRSMSGVATGMFDAPLLFEPGTSWQYGAGYDAVGVLVSRLTGLSLEDYMRRKIFDVLGLESPTFFIRRKEGGVGRLVQCVTRGKDGELVNFPDPTGDDAREEQGSGGLYCSVGDYVTVLIALLKEEPKVLSRETVEALLFSPQLQEGSDAYAGFMAAKYLWGAFSGGAPASAKVNHSLGGLLVEDGEKCTLQWAGGTGTVWIADRKKGVAGFLATQFFPPHDGEATKLRNAFLDLVRAM